MAQLCNHPFVVPYFIASAMEEKYYCLKASTAWTFAHWFQNGDYWDDSLKATGVPLSALIKEEDKQLQMGSNDGISNSGTTTDRSQNLEEDNSCEIPIQLSADVRQDTIDGVAEPTSHKEPKVASKNNKNSSTLLQRKRHACDKCEKTFRVPSELATHLRTHSGHKPFKCPLCDKSYHQKRILEIHLDIHKGAKPFPCPHCSYSGLQKPHLIRHLLTHSDEKPFTCDKCEESFKCITHLKRHKQVHSSEKPFSCSTCGKSFKTNSALKTHLLIHTKEKSFKCEQCGKCFSLNGSLKVHMRTHTGEKPYDCKVCGKTFAVVSNRNQHSRHCTSTVTIR